MFKPIKQINFKVWGARFLLVIASLFLTTIALESVLRLGWIKNRRHDHLRVMGEQENPDTRLMILGDSFLRRGSILIRSLNKRLERCKVAVLNTSVGGYGPFEYLEELKTTGSRFKPDIVLLGYYVGNDLTNVQNNRKFNPTSFRLKFKNIFRPFVRKFYIYHYYYEKKQVIPTRLFNYKRLKASGIPTNLIEEAKTYRINPWLLLHAQHEKNYLLDNILMETQENMRAWEKVKDLLDSIHDLCNRMGAAFLVAIFPRSVQVSDMNFEFFKSLNFNLDERTLKADKPQRLLKTFCDERKIPCLDFLPLFRQRSDQVLFRIKDEHFNDRGDSLVAELILDFTLKHIKE
jgi:hypothetical protein